jgi:hypothetical protein
VTHDANVAGHTKRAIRMRDGHIESGAFEAAPPPPADADPMMPLDAVAGTR